MIELDSLSDAELRPSHSNNRNNQADGELGSRWTGHAITMPLRSLLGYHQAGSVKHDKAKPLIDASSIKFMPVIIHTATITAALVLIILNLKGGFIGAKFAATHHDETQALSLLALQLCAKVIELSTVASLALIISDFLHYHLLFDEKGLPLGLSGAKLQFGDILFLLSAKFWAGIFALQAKRQRAFAAFLIISSGILAVFIGPSSALLLIPVIRDNWVAGQAQVLQNELLYPLYPSRIDNTTTNLIGCDPINFANLDYSSTLEFEHCPWISVTNLTVACKGIPWFDTEDAVRNITTHDGTHRRAILYSGDVTTETTGLWALSGSSRINYFNFQIYQLWLDAVSWASALPDTTYFARYYFLREYNGNTVQVISQIPAVLTKCYVQDDVVFNTSTAVDFPALPPYGLAFDGLYYIIHPNFTSPKNAVTSSWINPPLNYTLNSSRPLDLPYGYFPSAALLVQIPRQNSTTEGKILACSIDARWVEGTNSFTGFVGDDNSSDTLVPSVNDNVISSETNEWFPVDDGTWRSVELGVDWLNTLTLHKASGSTNDFNGNTTFNSCDDAVSCFVMDQAYTLNNNTAGNLTSIAASYGAGAWDVHILELFISTLVTDAMSRLNIDQTDQPAFNADVSNVDPTSPDYNTRISSLYKPILEGNLELSVNETGTLAASDPLIWTIYISGYSYKADSTAYYLAIIAVTAALLMSVAHVAYLLLKQLSSSRLVAYMPWIQYFPDEQQGWSSEACGDVQDIIRLALQSPMQSLPKKPESHFGAYKERQPSLMLRVRRNASSPTGQASAKYGHEPFIEDHGFSYQDSPEQVHLIQARNGPEYQIAEKGKKYD